MTNANKDDKLVETRAKFGMWGIGAYWTILEMIAEQMKGTNPVPEATFSKKELCSHFQCKRTKLETFLEHLQNVFEMKLKPTGGNADVFKIICQKLLKIKDNYTKDLEVK